MHTPEPIHGTVLLIDRDDRLGKERAAFEREGMTVISASSVEDGLAKARDQRPDLVVSEVMLEKPDAGFVLGYKLKKDAATAEIPLLLLSSIFQQTGKVFDLSSPAARQWIKADAYLERPIAPDHLISKVRGLLQKPTANGTH